MKVLLIVCALFAFAQANPAFRALRARASGLAGGGVPPPLPANSPLAQALNQAQAQPQLAQAYRPTFQAQAQPQYQPAFQAQPQYQQYQPQPQYQQYQAPFAGFQPVQG